MAGESPSRVLSDPTALAPTAADSPCAAPVSQLFGAFGQAVRLQIEEQLQAMFGLAQKAIGVVEDAIFLIGQAADALEGLHGQQGVALAHLRQIAAVEQLQKLNREFDVADAAVSGFDLACR